MTARLVTPEALAGRLGDPALRVLDATVWLDRPPGGGPYAPRSGLATFADGHVPGAGFADLLGALADPGAPQHFAWPDPERFARAIGALGVGDGVAVVVYAQEAPMWATRLWFLLRAHGLDDVAVLDGGLRAWRAAGLPVETGPPSAAEPRSFTPRLRPELLAARDEVLAVVRGEDGSSATRLVNALRPEVFRGEGRTSYARPGRIPGSVNVPHPSLVDPETGRFRAPEQLRERLAAAGVLDPAAPAVAYCGGGVSATVLLFALALAGREDVRLYDGSLAEWSADPALPLEVG